MNLKTISRNVGYALLVSALFMLLSVLVSVLNGNDSALAALLISFSITFVVGLFPFIFVRKTSQISLKDGYMIIVLSWLLSFLFGMLPYALWGGPFTISNAWFESVSGFTTTGATILEDIESLPRSLIFWRSSTHFIGGLGIVVFLLLIIPDTSPLKFRLTNMEISSLSREGYQSRVNRTVSIFATVYIALNVLSFLLYLVAGMSPFDAINHAFSVSATGGFSTRNLSIGAFDSVWIDLITMVFMFLSSVHFGLIFMVFATRSLKPVRNPVVRLYFWSIIFITVLSAVALKVTGYAEGWGRTFLESSFTVLSYASTTGFAISDNSTWPMLPCFLLLLVSIICGCAGSTTGGVKIDRILVLVKAVRMQIRRALHPKSISEIRLGKSILREENVYPHVLYLCLYLIMIVVSIIVCSVSGASGFDAIAGTISNLGTVGPSIGDIGSMGNYNTQPDFVKFVFSMDMFFGRVEIYPILAVFSMVFGKSRQ